MNQLIDDTANLKAWQAAMGEFNNMEKKTAESVTSWKEKHIHNVLFTYRQKDAIAERAVNVISGFWGRSKENVKMEGSK